MKEHENLLENLVAIKSYSGEESDIRSYIGAWFAQRDIESFVQDDNLLAYIQGLDQERAFIFNSHMDTVSKGDQEWTYGPWNPTKVGDKMFGLGTSDMKSGMAATMLLTEKIVSSGKPPVDMWFTYVTKEELDGSGTENFARWFKESGKLDRYCEVAGIFTEPTGMKELQYGHRGNMFLRATVEGDSGHASSPSLIKKHSVREMIRFADVLRQEFGQWSKEFENSVFEPPTVGEMTSIQAGVAVSGSRENPLIEVESPNKFPSVCSATFDIRTTPDFHALAFDRIKELGASAGVKIEYAFPPAPAGYTDPQDKLVVATKTVLPKIELTVSKASADLGFLTIHGIKAVILGPGEKNQMHLTDEYCYPDQIPQAVDTYDGIIQKWAT